MIKAFIFDFDGVIVESVNIKTEAFAELFQGEGEAVVGRVVAFHLNNTGVSRYEKIRHIYNEILNRPLSDEKFKMLCDKFEDLVVQRVIQAPYVKGAKEFLEKFAVKFKYFLVSATPQKEIEEIVEKRKIGHLFKTIYGAPAKKTDAVRAILSEENLRPSEAVYLGDAMSDYKAAKDNSVQFIAVTNDNQSLFSRIDCLKIKDFTQLYRTIEPL